MTKPGPSEVDVENVQPITKDQLKESDKAELKAHNKHYEEFCLASYGQTKSGVLTATGPRSYRHQTLEGEDISNSWNVDQLCRFYM
jgi:hypothetical protein